MQKSYSERKIREKVTEESGNCQKRFLSFIHFTGSKILDSNGIGTVNNSDLQLKIEMKDLIPWCQVSNGKNVRTFFMIT